MVPASKLAPRPFQSTLLAREATSVGISTSTIALFQSTLPAREATSKDRAKHIAIKFQSTLPAGEATSREIIRIGKLAISIHASRGGSDLKKLKGSPVTNLFQSTLPAGEATNKDLCFMVMARKFQSTLPAGEATISMELILQQE